MGFAFAAFYLVLSCATAFALYAIAPAELKADIMDRIENI
jgi:hypothetical protein